jgi:hypothetical protein
MATAKPLPTTQIDGVAWSQEVVGRRVFVAGGFSNARPAGAAPGTQLTPRRNLLAYDIDTGELDVNFMPDLNASALVVEASPDGSRVYVGGVFTEANGVARQRIAAYSVATGELIESFAPPLNGPVRAIAVTNDAVYVGGDFTAVGTSPRKRLAAFRPSDGSLLGWSPGAQGGGVYALLVSPDHKRWWSDAAWAGCGRCLDRWADRVGDQRRPHQQWRQRRHPQLGDRWTGDLRQRVRVEACGRRRQPRGHVLGRSG